MKIIVQMKDPDAMHDAVWESVRNEVKAMGLPDDETQSIIELRAEKLREKLCKWFDFGEYLTCEFDTDTMTATVKESKE